MVDGLLVSDGRSSSSPEDRASVLELEWSTCCDLIGCRANLINQQAIQQYIREEEVEP